MKILVLGNLSLFVLCGCNKTEQSGPDSSVSQQQESFPKDLKDGEAEQEAEENAGALQINASIELGVIPVNANGAFLANNTERNASVGTTGALNLPLSGGAPLTTNVPLTPHPSNIASAAPDEFKFYITEIRLKPKGQGKDVTVFRDDGAEVYIKESGVVDLSAVIASAKKQGVDAASKDSGGTVKFTVAPGTYETIEVAYLVRAYVKGCVEADWSRPELLTDAETGLIKYCTRSGKDTFALKADTKHTLADFQYVEAGTESQREVSLMKFNIAKGRTTLPASETETLNVIYRPIDPIIIKEDESTPLSLLIDMNRLLRFYRAGESGGNGQEKTPNPGMEKGPYFFTTIFAESTAVFVGTPGRIMGYELIVQACKTANYVQTGASYSCVDTWESAQESCGAPRTWSSGVCSEQLTFDVIGGWMTLLFDAQNRPLFGVLYPDDDNTLTIIKGTSSGLVDKSTGLPNFIRASENDAAKLDIHYWLGDEPNHLSGFTEDFFNTELDAVIAGIFLHAKHPQGDLTGPVTVVRKL